MRILIVRLSALGDIVHALPVLGAIRKAMPAAQVDWLVEENYASILSIENLPVCIFPLQTILLRWLSSHPADPLLEPSFISRVADAPDLVCFADTHNASPEAHR